MPFAPVAAAVAGAAVSGGISALTKGNQSGAISTGQQQANTVLQPYVDTGENALTKYADLQGINGQPAADAAMSTFQKSPGYDYRVSEGLRAVDAGAAASGMLRSGATIKAEETLGSNLANQDFGAYVSRLNDLSKFGLQGAGLTASTDTSAAGQQASIAGAQGTGFSNAAGLATGAVTNGLTKYFAGPSDDGIYGSSGFQTGSGGTNSSGANTLQSLGFYNPLPQ